jgi:hypothetical protein
MIFAKGIVVIPISVAMVLIGLQLWQDLNGVWRYVIALPVLIVGITLTISFSYDFIVGLISSQWRRTHCPFCETPKNVKKILSET